MQESIAILVRVQCHRKESSRSSSHLLMSFLFLLRRLQITDYYNRPTLVEGDAEQYDSERLFTNR